MSPSHDLPAIDVLTVGAVGPPGKRVFYLQARGTGQLVTLKLEKQQVAALSQAVLELLADLPPPGPLPTALELEDPIHPEWVVGAMALGAYDETTDRALLVAQEAVEEGEPPGEVARFGVSREQLAALAQRGLELVAAGRPPCPLCGRPLDPTGHLCPRSNGHLAR
jgi:uncharacterized repeat protein (TIGR03847 family)